MTHARAKYRGENMASSKAVVETDGPHLSHVVYWW